MNTQLVPIPNADGYYVTRDGKVYSSWKPYQRGRRAGIFYVKTDGYFKKLSEAKDKDGYPRACLLIGGKRITKKVHHLVLEAHGFQKPFPKAQVRHLNGVRDDNRLENLKWGTAKENGEDAAIHGTLKGENNAHTHLKEQDIRDMRCGMTAKDISSKYGISKSQAYRILYGESWQHVN